MDGLIFFIILKNENTIKTKGMMDKMLLSRTAFGIVDTVFS